MILLLGAALAQSWEVAPYARPVGGISAFGEARAVTLGAQVGFVAWQPGTLLATQTRAQAATHLYSGVGGSDVRLGSFWVLWHEYFALMAGPDLCRNVFRAGPTELLPPSVGLDLPLMLRLGPQELHVSAAVVPSWLANPDRRADLPLVHEFEWRAGFVIDGPVSFGLYYTRRHTVFGLQEGLGFSVGL